MDHETLRMVWTQAWQVSLLILAVAGLTRLWGRNHPHFAHALWVVVLVKAVTPPLWTSSAGVFSRIQSPQERPQPEVSEKPPGQEAEEIAEPIEPPVAVSRFDPALFADAPIIPDEGKPALPPRVPAAEVPPVTDVPQREVKPPEPHPEPVKAESSQPLWSWVLVFVWAIGAIGSLLLAWIRWHLCKRAIRRAEQVDDPAVQELLQSLARRIGLRRKVRLIISKSRIGPAVWGIVRPIVLIPHRVIQGKCPSDLEPILAHELIHVRRGDLWVGWLCVLVQAVWWFHPLVWWAGRLIKREAERCCDEEVVAELGLNPARYARALLDVLEQKQSLKSVPVLPGVKPVEITSQRLERIMLLRQGCRKRTPWWCWLVMLLAAALTLPGAAFVASAKDEHKTQPAAQPSQAEETSLLKTRTYKVGELLEQIQTEFQLPDDTAARQTLVGLLKSFTQGMWNKDHLLVNKQQVGTSSIFIKGDKLTVRNSPAVQKEIAKQIELFRKHGLQQVVIEARILSVSNHFFERLGMDFDLKTIKAETSRTGGQDTAEKAIPAAMAICNDVEAKRFIKACQSDARSNLMFCPKVTVFNGQHATIQDTVQRPFVVEISSDGKPTVRVVEEGTKIRLRAIWEGDHIRLESQVTVSDIRKVDVVDLPGKPGKETSPKVQVPEVAFTRINNTVKLPSGGSVLLGGIKQVREGRIMAGDPILSKIPYVSRLFKTTGVVHENPDQQLFVMLRVVHLENAPEQLPAPAKNATNASDVELRYAQKAAELAVLEYEKALEANRILKGSVSQLDVERLKLKAELAQLHVEQVTHELELAKQSRDAEFSNQNVPKARSLVPTLDPTIGVWEDTLEAAEEQARKKQLPILLHFRADWSGPCHTMQKELFRKNEFRRLLGNKFVGVKIDIDEWGKLQKRFNVTSIPADILITPDGKELARKVGLKNSAKDYDRLFSEAKQNAEREERQLFGLGVNSDAGVTGTIVIDEKNFALNKIEPPTDEAVLAALDHKQKSDDKPFSATIERRNVRIVKERMPNVIEPVRDYPQVGRARMVTSEFQCTVFYDKVGGSSSPGPFENVTPTKDVVTIKSFQLVPANDEWKPKPPKPAEDAVQPAAYADEYCPPPRVHSGTTEGDAKKDAEFAKMVEEFNQLFENKRYQEAEKLAQKTKEMYPESPTAEAMFWKSRYVLREMQSDALKKEAQERRKRSEEAEKFDATLKRTTTLKFKDTPLSEVVKQLATQHGIDIVLDNAGLSEEGITADQPVTINVDGIKLSSALNLLLKPLRLNYHIEDEVLKITSQTRIDLKSVTVRTYPVADLVVPVPRMSTVDLRAKPAPAKPESGKIERPVPPPANAKASPEPGKEKAWDFEGRIRPKAGEKTPIDFDDLTKLITSSVEPNTWAERGGIGSIRGYETTLSLVIRQTDRVHEQVAEVLEQLRRLQDVQVSLQAQTIEVADALDSKLLKSLKAGKPVTVNGDELSKFLKTAAKGGTLPNMTSLPKMTLFNGQTLDMILPTADEDGMKLELSPVSSADRRFVRLQLALSSDPAEGQDHLSQHHLKDGHSLLLDVTKHHGDKSGKRRLLLITPTILVAEEEEELLGKKTVIPAKEAAFVSTVTPTMIIEEEEEELLSVPAEN